MRLASKMFLTSALVVVVLAVVGVLSLRAVGRLASVNREILRIIALPEVKEKLAAIGFEPIGTTPEEFATRIKVDVPKWAKIVREANIKLD